MPITESEPGERPQRGLTFAGRMLFTDIAMVRGHGSMVEQRLPKPQIRVRFPLPAPLLTDYRTELSPAVAVFDCVASPDSGMLFEIR